MKLHFRFPGFAVFALGFNAWLLFTVFVATSPLAQRGWLACRTYSFFFHQAQNRSLHFPFAARHWQWKSEEISFYQHYPGFTRNGQRHPLILTGNQDPMGFCFKEYFKITSQCFKRFEGWFERDRAESLCADLKSNSPWTHRVGNCG